MEVKKPLSTFQNQYGISFQVISVPINQPKNYFNTFQCQFFNHILLTKNGAKKHNCQSFRRDKIIDKYTDRHVMVMHYILRYIATSNIPFRAADSKFLRNALSIFKCVPKLLTIRWDSLFKCVSYIVKHYQQINQNSNLANSLKKIEDTIGWEQLHDLLEIMDTFIKSVEKDLATISDVGFHFLIAYNQ